MDGDSKNIQTFNKLFEEFLDKLYLKFQSDRLKLYKKTFIIIKNSESHIPSFLFMLSCLDYKKEITNRDELFFIGNEKIKKDCNSFFKIDSDLINLNVLTPLDKKAIWDYIQSLFVLGEIIITKNKQLFEEYEKSYSLDILKKLNSF